MYEVLNTHDTKKKSINYTQRFQIDYYLVLHNNKKIRADSFH